MQASFFCCLVTLISSVWSSLTPSVTVSALTRAHGSSKSSSAACGAYGEPCSDIPAGTLMLPFSACRDAGDGASCGTASGVLPAGSGHQSDWRRAHDAGRCARHASQSRPQLACALCVPAYFWRCTPHECRCCRSIFTGQVSAPQETSFKRCTPTSAANPRDEGRMHSWTNRDACPCRAAA